MFYRAKHVLPRRLERIGRRLPRESLGPASQEPTEARREPALPRGPGHLLNRYAARRALHAPHGIDEENGHAPQRHKLKPPRWQPVVSWPLLPTARTDRPTVRPRLDLDLDLRGASSGLDQSCPLVNERLERMDVIENSLEVHPAVAPERTRSKQPHLLPNSAAGCLSFSPWSARQGGASRRRNAAACRLPIHATGSQPLHRSALTTAPARPSPSRALRWPQADARVSVPELRGHGQRFATQTGASTHEFC